MFAPSLSANICSLWALDVQEGVREGVRAALQQHVALRVRLEQTRAKQALIDAIKQVGLGSTSPLALSNLQWLVFLFSYDCPLVLLFCSLVSQLVAASQSVEQLATGPDVAQTVQAACTLVGAFSLLIYYRRCK